MTIPRICAIGDDLDFRKAVARTLSGAVEGGEWNIDYIDKGAALPDTLDCDVLLLDIKTPIEVASALFSSVEGRLKSAKILIVAALPAEEPRATSSRDLFYAMSKHAAFEPLEPLLRRTLGESAVENAMSEEVERRADLQTLLRSSPLFGEFDEEAMRAMTAEFETVMLDGGDVLFRQGDPGDSLYIVVSGHLEVRKATPGEQPKVVATLGPAESVGEMALIDGDPRSATVAATRDTLLARLSDVAFKRLVERHPKAILSAFLRLTSKRLRGETARLVERKPANDCIAIVPLAPEIDIARLARAIAEGLALFRPTLPLCVESLDRTYGLTGAARFAAGHVGHLLLANWLAEQERAHRTLVYTAEFGPTAWTNRCWRQSDCVLFVVGRGSDPVAARDLVAELSRIGHPAKKRIFLAILHDPQHGEPRDTRLWTEAVGAQKLFHVRANVPEDVSRLTRFLCGRSVGLALGGGFARGLGHIGVVRAMREMGVPIDMVGGTSMGAIIAGQCALEWEWPKMLEISMKSSAESVRGDFTLPLVSFLTGRKMSRTIEEIGEGRDIEDALLPSFCVSANLMDGQMRVHTAGPAAKAVLASARMPVMFPPISWDGALLVDGGLVNMVPARTMREFCNGVVISVDCSVGSGLRAPDYGLAHSGWTELWRRFRSRAAGYPKVGIMDILMHSFEFGRVSHANPALHSDLYLELPLAGYSHRDFSHGPQMAEASYRYTLSQLEAWTAENGRPWEPDKGA